LESFFSKWRSKPLTPHLCLWHVAGFAVYLKNLVVVLIIALMSFLFTFFS